MVAKLRIGGVALHRLSPHGNARRNCGVRGVLGRRGGGDHILQAQRHQAAREEGWPAGGEGRVGQALCGPVRAGQEHAGAAQEERVQARARGRRHPPPRRRVRRVPRRRQPRRAPRGGLRDREPRDGGARAEQAGGDAVGAHVGGRADAARRVHRGAEAPPADGRRRRLVRQPAVGGRVGRPRRRRHVPAGVPLGRAQRARRAVQARVRRVVVPRPRLHLARRRDAARRGGEGADAPGALPGAHPLPPPQGRERRQVPRAAALRVRPVPRHVRQRDRRPPRRAAVGLLRRGDAVAAEAAEGVHRGRQGARHRRRLRRGDVRPRPPRRRAQRRHRLLPLRVLGPPARLRHVRQGASEHGRARRAAPPPAAPPRPPPSSRPTPHPPPPPPPSRRSAAARATCSRARSSSTRRRSSRGRRTAPPSSRTPTAARRRAPSPTALRSSRRCRRGGRRSARSARRSSRRSTRSTTRTARTRGA